MISDLPGKIFTIKTSRDFTETALEIFRYQSEVSEIYRKYMRLLGVRSDDVCQIEDIPFLPVSLFRKYPVKSFRGKPQNIFTSSGTSSTIPSKHYVYDLSLYEKSFLTAFRLFYGDPAGMSVLALLPTYLERSGSSLIYMIDKLIKLSGSPFSGYYLYNHKRLYHRLRELAAKKERVLLFGVSYALLDFAEKYEVLVPGMIVMETGGMKGRRKEMVREELHGILTSRFHVTSVHSEYGMTELLSQAYSQGKGIYAAPPWMQILIRDPYDPLSFLPPGRHGGINVIDLANLYSCAFIETGDLGICFPDGTFSVSGRFDHSELRGCNLMVQEI
ncbi:MAG: acyl transferase [Chlorobi bacterium]|nr:acyl transferase [Chlorobiota bacterium]